MQQANGKFNRLLATGKLNLHAFSLFFKLLIILLLPHVVFVGLKASSLALGIILCALLFLPWYFSKLLKASFNLVGLISVFVIYLLVSIYSIYSLATTLDLKSIYSLVILITLLISLDLKNNYKLLDVTQLKSVFFGLYLTLFMLGFASLFLDITILNYGLHEKPVFPFSEQSHYSLALGIVGVALVSVSSMLVSLFSILTMTFLAFSFPNLTLLVFVVISTFILVLKLDLIIRFFFVITGVIPLMFIGLFLISGSEYFSSRLSFEDINNLTTLVWVQGWQLAYLNLIETNGIGLGFQALGLSTTILPETSSLIYQISGKFNNINDGGFLAVKLISEFGVFGVLLSIFYLWWLFGYILNFNHTYNPTTKGTDSGSIEGKKKELMLSTIIFAFVVEFFLRGYGYFSPTALIVLSAVLYLIEYRRKYENNYSQ